MVTPTRDPAIHEMTKRGLDGTIGATPTLANAHMARRPSSLTPRWAPTPKAGTNGIWPTSPAVDPRRVIPQPGRCDANTRQLTFGTQAVITHPALGPNA